MAEMSKKEVGDFLIRGTFTGKLATLRRDGSPRVVPIWFVLAESNRRNGRGGSKVGYIIFTTGSTSIKAKNIECDSRVSICIDDQVPPFSFVTIYGTAKIYHYKKNKLFKWATKIALRYMGKDNAENYGRRYSTKGEVLVRIKPTKIIAEKDVAG